MHLFSNEEWQKSLLQNEVHKKFLKNDINKKRLNLGDQAPISSEDSCFSSEDSYMAGTSSLAQSDS